MNDPDPDDDHDPRQRAQELQMDAFLTEIAGQVPGDDLVSRIVDRVLTTQPVAGRVALRGARSATRSTRGLASRPWLAAAAIVLGIGAVTATALLRRNDRPAEHQAVAPVTQDPQPKPQEPAPQPPAKPKASYTLIADYSENKVYEVDADGRIVFQLDDLFGAWDAEELANGNLLITLFSVSRVVEMTRKGEEVWAFEDGLRNPYDADRLPNGNTLIADTFGDRVIEVDAKGNIVWQLDRLVDGDEKKPFRPFDCDRLANGNTLIADVMGNRVVEVDRDGKVVWQVRDLQQVHDADRLANGNTLITLRNLGKVIEVDGTGKVVWQKKGLSTPFDADRLANGNTLITENVRVCEVDPDGKVVWSRETTWSVEANRYER